MPPLTHFTVNPAAISGILSHGFAWVPNRRNLAVQLVPEHDFSRREPQQFGMISFTEIKPNEATEHRVKFGHFGITVSVKWAAKHRAQRVIYIPVAGPLADALRNVFAIGYQDLQARIEHPNDGAWQMSWENRAMADAVAGASLWANLLGIWEYLEPESSSAQREWRIVNDSPDYSIFGPTKDIIADVSPPRNWAKFTRVLPVQLGDIVQFVAPRSRVDELREVVPPPFAEVPIVETDG